MSGDTAPAPTTSDIATQVIAEFDATEATPEVTTSETPAPPVETPSPEPEPSPQPAVREPPQPELSPAAKFLEQQGHKPTKVDGRPNWLPIKTVEGMLGRFVEQQQSTWHEARTAIETERNTYKADLDEFYTDVRGDPAQFLAKLAQADPRYQAFLERPPAPAAAPMAEMPAPDLSLPDGSQTYSLNGLKKLMEWNTAATKAQTLAEVDTRLKPWQERDKAEKERAAAESAATTRRERTQKLMADAQTWPLFGTFAADGVLTPFQQKVLATLKADPTIDFRGAYMKHALPLLGERKQLLEDINHAPKAPTVGRSGAEAVKAPGPPSTRDIAASVIARLESGS